MTGRRANEDPPKPDIDENGVDRAQIRAMLALTPSERLQRVQEFVEAAMNVRELETRRTVRCEEMSLPSGRTIRVLSVPAPIDALRPSDPEEGDQMSRGTGVQAPAARK